MGGVVSKVAKEVTRPFRQLFGGGGGGGPQPVAQEQSNNAAAEEWARQLEARTKAAEEAQKRAEAAQRAAEAAQRAIEAARAKQHAADMASQREESNQLRKQIGELEKDNRLREQELKRLEALRAAAEAARQAAEAKERAAREKAEQERAANQQRAAEVGIDYDNNYIISFAGDSGVGKSTAMNSLNGKKNTDEGALRTSAFSECTKQFAQRPWRDTAIQLVDIPGCGTTFSPSKDYCYRYCLDLLDCLVLCFHRDFKEGTDLAIQYAVEHNVKVILVHTKTDASIASLVQEADEELSPGQAEAIFRAGVSKVIVSKLRELGVPDDREVPLFCINGIALRTCARWRYDEARLLEELIRSTARRHPGNLTEEELLDAVLEAAGIVPDEPGNALQAA